MGVVDLKPSDQAIQVYDDATGRSKWISPAELGACVKCGKRLRESRTDRYPFGDGYICKSCRERVAENFCQAAAEYNATLPDNAMPVEEMIKRFL